MEFTARVGSILRGLLPRRWITESGRQRLGGLFECLLQEAGMPPPTFYAATLSVCSGNRLASPVHTYCAWIRSSPSSLHTPSPVAEYRNTNTNDSCHSCSTRLEDFIENFPAKKSSWVTEFLQFCASFPRTLESIRFENSLLTERIKLYIDYSLLPTIFRGINQVSRKNEKIGNSERNWETWISDPFSKGPSSKNSSSHVLSGIPDSTWWLHDSTLRGIKSKRTGRNEDLGGRKTGVIQTNDRAVKEWQLRAIRAMTENLPVHASSSGISSSRFLPLPTRWIRHRYYPCTFQHASSAGSRREEFLSRANCLIIPGERWRERVIEITLSSASWITWLVATFLEERFLFF